MKRPKTLFFKKHQAFLLGLMVLFGVWDPKSAIGVTQYKPSQTPFFFSLNQFKTSLTLPLEDQPKTVRMSLNKLKQRLERSKNEDIVEPLALVLRNDETQLVQTAERIGRAGQVEDLLDYLRRGYSKAEPTVAESEARTVIIDDNGFKLLDPFAFSDLFARTHHQLTLNTRPLQNDRTLRRKLFGQVRRFLDKRQLRTMRILVRQGQPIDVDTHLLPEFAKKTVGKFVVYRGPNCFHAALAFHSPIMPGSSLINVKKETGYHRAMINYDELWRVLSRNFYEVDPTKSPLEYGDMLVFFDVPKDQGETRDVDFRWIRHTTTYLFDKYTYSKGSKSPNTPYTIRTIGEEWKSWQGYVENLAVKVFRRSQNRVKKHPPMDLADWMY